MYRPLFLLFGSIVSLMVGCGPSDPPHNTKAVQVSWQGLVNDYRDFPDVADRAYRNRTVQIYLQSGDQGYRISTGKIEAYAVVQGQPGALVFECEPPSQNNNNALLITGICRGRVRDGIERANGIQFFVRITDCRVTILDHTK